MPLEYHRTDRIAAEMMRDLSTLIRTELRDPRIGMVSIHEIRVSKDLSVAKVYYTILDQQEAGETQAVLDRASGFLRHHLGKMIRLRKIPELRFIFDTTLVSANELTALIEHSVAADKRKHPDEI